MSRPRRKVGFTCRFCSTASFRALWLVGLLGLLAAGVATAQAKPPEEPRSQTYYDRFSHGRPQAAETAAQEVDVDAAPRVSWINPAGGSWTDGANWSGGAMPGEGDHAVIDLEGTYTVTLEADARITALTLGAASGEQTLMVPADAIALRGPATVGARGVLELNGGRITGDGDLIVHGAVVWSGGAMSGRGKARIAADGRLEIVGDQRKVLSLRHIENSGSMRWAGTGSLVVTFAAQIHNLEQGRFEVATSGLLDVYGPSGPAVDNAGILIKTGDGTTVFEAPLTSSGTVILQGGSFHLLAGYTQTAGSISLASAELVSPAGVLIGGGVLQGEGTVKGDLTNGGRIDPEDGSGRIEVVGDYTQTASGSLRLDLGGDGAPRWDRLQVSGRASLDGTLELRRPAGDGLPDGSLEVLTFAAREGEFAGIEGLTAPGGRTLEAHFEEGALRLR